ncbi:unnamed protein product [Rotaria magnacalcarata]|uniref:Uncharacterized protein n=2 Tax=Rotaria magnacalcarata TaxID=392030 RepID=A0A815V8M6_9BILA|nr:unnamed protein product [Rotaria magnacalcarata]
MEKSWFSDFFSTVLRLAGGCACILFIPCVVVGSMGASNYANNRSFRNAHTHTTCLLLNYTVFKYRCQSCDQDTCSYYTCFDENFEFSYPISNQTVVRSRFSSISKKTTHKQTQIGQNYTCYYTTKQVTSVIFELPSIKTPLVQICVSFGLLGLPVIFIFLSFFGGIAAAMDCSSSCSPNIKRFTTQIFDKMRMKKSAAVENNVELIGIIRC